MLNVELFDSIATHIKLNATQIEKDLNTGNIIAYYDAFWSYFPANKTYNTLEHINSNSVDIIRKEKNRVTIVIDYATDFPNSEVRAFLIEIYNSIIAET